MTAAIKDNNGTSVIRFTAMERAVLGLGGGLISAVLVALVALVLRNNISAAETAVKMGQLTEDFSRMREEMRDRTAKRYTSDDAAGDRATVMMLISQLTSKNESQDTILHSNRERITALEARINISPSK